MNYQQAIGYISSYTDYEKVPMPHDPAFYDLRRVDELLAQIGNPHLKARSVHITGTNGKGSTAAMIASALTTSGYTTGLYTSPHLHSWRERIRIDGALISEEELAALITRLQPEIEEVNRKATYGHLTTFELLTTLAFAYFGQREVDFQVLEVGMGGKFDATSVITPEVSIITSISLDHTEVLGNTLPKIAAEKAAIIKSGSTVVISPQPDEADRIIAETCLNRGTKLIRIGSDVTWESLGFDLSRQMLRVKGRMDSYELSIPLLGQHQLDNAATAVASLEVLAGKGFHISRDSIVRGLEQVKWPGRLQILRHKPLMMADGAHNPDAARKLIEFMKQYCKFDSAILIIGVSEDKNIAGIAPELSPYFDTVIATCSHHPRAMPPERIAAEFRKHGIEVKQIEDITEALSLARSLAGSEDLICIAGSLFVVAEAIEKLKLETGTL